MKRSGPSSAKTNITLPLDTFAHVEALRKGGLYGGTTAEVLRSLVMVGLQDAARHGFIKIGK